MVILPHHKRDDMNPQAQPLFTADFFINNRKRLREHSKAKLIVLSANGMLQRSGDTNFAFRQESNFWYLTGIDEPDFVLVMSQSDEFIIMPARHAHRDQWDGAIDTSAMEASSGVKKFIPHDDGWKLLQKLIKKARTVHTRVPVPPYIEIIGLYMNPAPVRLTRELKRRGAVELSSLRESLVALRQVKQAPEIAAMQRAIDVTCQTLHDVKSQLKQYDFEYEIEADITAGFRRRGADGHAYTPIVGSGLNAATIHYIANNDPLDKDRQLLIDVGAEYKHYAADVTRTYAIHKPSDRLKQIAEVVKGVSQEAFNRLKPGIILRDYEAEIDKVMARELKNLGLIESVNDKDGLREYYPHLVSHFLGLDAHDAGDYDAPLQAGVVVTVEPGIYIADENIGVRIEDDVLITNDGIQILSDQLPRDL